MGGHGAWHLATHFPDRTIGLISLAGWIKKEEYGDACLVWLLVGWLTFLFCLVCWLVGRLVGWFFCVVGLLPGCKAGSVSNVQQWACKILFIALITVVSLA